MRAYVSAALHAGLKGERLTEMRLLKEAGAFCVSDDGLGTASAGVLRNGMLYARSAGLPVILHCEDHTLATGVVRRSLFRARRSPGIARELRGRGDGDGPRASGGDGGEGPHNPRLDRALRGSRRVLQGPG